MSTAAVQAPGQDVKALSLVEKGAPIQVEDIRLVDDHPLIVVGIFMAIALTAAGAFVGSILLCLALRHSGVLGFTI